MVKIMNNDEIKEIIDNIKKCCNITKDQNFTVYQRQDILKLLDYITNLQQENQKLKELDENYPIEEELAEAYRREENYKSIIEKAAEYIKENAKYKKVSINNRKYYNEYLINQVLDILNGRSDE